MNKKTILVTRRLQNGEKNKSFILELTAEERTKLRCRRKTICGLELLLQLPREGRILPGEILVGVNDGPRILVVAAKEDLLEVKASSNLKLLKAAYHLGNRHVDLELHTNEIYLQDDIVLQEMLLQRGLSVRTVQRSFHPEYGAYDHNHVS